MRKTFGTPQIEQPDRKVRKLFCVPKWKQWREPVSFLMVLFIVEINDAQFGKKINNSTRYCSLRSQFAIWPHHYWIPGCKTAQFQGKYRRSLKKPYDLVVRTLFIWRKGRYSVSWPQRSPKISYFSLDEVSSMQAADTARARAVLSCPHSGTLPGCFGLVWLMAETALELQLGHHHLVSPQQVLLILSEDYRE